MSEIFTLGMWIEWGEGINCVPKIAGISAA